MRGSGDIGSGGAITARAVVIGCAVCAAIGVAGPYWTLYQMSSGMFTDYHMAGATLALLVLVLVFNVVLGWLWRGAALEGRELRLITAMTLFSGSIVTAGAVCYLVSGITSPYYFAPYVAEMRERLWERLPQWLFPLDPNGGTIAIQKWWNGLAGGEPIPWGPWIGPLLWWGLFLMAAFACMIAVTAIMRKQWVDHEHLSYPIAQIPGAICAAVEEPASPASVFRSKGFWIGACLTFALATSNGLNFYFGIFPAFRIQAEITGLGPMALPINLPLIVVALVFLIPNRVSFSVWFLTLISWGVRNFLRTYGFGVQDWMLYGVVGHPELHHMAMGAMIAFVVGSLWMSRRHLRRALCCALGVRDRAYDAAEPCSYRTAFLTLAGGGLVMIGWLHAAGLGIGWAVILLAITFVVYYGMARVIAQCGLPSINSPVIPSSYMASTFGSQTLGADQSVVLGLHLTWHADVRNSPMSGAGHGMYLARRRTRGIFWPMMLGLLISYLVAYLFTVWLGYRFGTVNLHPWYMTNSARLTWHWTTFLAGETQSPSYMGMVWMAAGALIMGALMVAQVMFFWWPIHPVGFLTCTAFLVTAFWFAIFMAWLVKVIVTYAGGPGAYRGARRFFIGVLMGYFVAGGIWSVIDMLAERTGNAVMSL